MTNRSPKGKKIVTSDQSPPVAKRTRLSSQSSKDSNYERFRTPEWCSRAKHARSCRVALATALQDKSPRLARPFARGLNSWLNLVARLSHQNTLFGKNWLFTFVLTLLYIYPYTHDLERASRENFERETLEKTRLTHPQSLPKRLFKFLYYLPLHCKILERLITNTFSHYINFCERAVWCFGKQLGRNQFHIGW